jgi:hypothetical protein
MDAPKYININFGYKNMYILEQLLWCMSDAYIKQRAHRALHEGDLHSYMQEVYNEVCIGREFTRQEAKIITYRLTFMTGPTALTEVTKNKGHTALLMQWFTNNINIEKFRPIKKGEVVFLKAFREKVLEELNTTYDISFKDCNVIIDHPNNLQLIPRLLGKLNKCHKDARDELEMRGMKPPSSWITESL